jgi:hypothetical protein
MAAAKLKPAPHTAPVAASLKRMGIEALYRRPRTTKPEPGHRIYPYLLRGMEIVRPNQVWAYIPMARGFVYLAVVLDWFSRRVLSWRVSITMELRSVADECADTVPQIHERTVLAGLALGDVLLAQKIGLETIERGALAVANSQPVRV